MGIRIHTIELTPHVYGTTKVTPQIKYLRVENGRQGHLALIGENADRINLLRKAGLFSLPKDVQYMGHAMRKSLIGEQAWFSKQTSERLFREYMSYLSMTRLVVGTNSEHAPLHDHIVSFDRNNHNSWLASKDFETAEKPLSKRIYFCLTHNRSDVNIGWVEFDDKGIPKNWDPAIQLAIGGRPLVIGGKPAPLAYILETCQSDLRHVIRLPEMDLGGGPGRYLPLGMITIQDMIREGRAEEIIRKINDGEPILISLERERDFDNGLNVDQIPAAMARFGYGEKDWWLANGSLYVKLKLNGYRHTLWATKDKDVLVAMVTNDLGLNEGQFDHFDYDRVMKPTGGTILELQSMLINHLGVDNAVLMGSGKDSGIYISEKEDINADERDVRIIRDSDGRERTSAGIICLFA